MPGSMMLSVFKINAGFVDFKVAFIEETVLSTVSFLKVGTTEMLSPGSIIPFPLPEASIALLLAFVIKRKLTLGLNQQRGRLPSRKPNAE